MALPAFVGRVRIEDEPRLAVFDADGTLWDQDFGDEFLVWMVGTRRLRVTESEWSDYKRIRAANPTAGRRYYLTLFAGLEAAELAHSIARYWATQAQPNFLEQPVEVMEYLAARDFNIWIATGLPGALLQPLCNRLPVHRIVGTRFELDRDRALTGRPAGAVTTGLGKVVKVLRTWDGPIQLVAADSLLDEPMLRMARDIAWVVNPQPDLAAIARVEGWEISRVGRLLRGRGRWVRLRDELSVRGFQTAALERAS